MKKISQFVKQAARRVAIGITIVLLIAGSQLALSDTTEVRPSDLRPAANKVDPTPHGGKDHRPSDLQPSSNRSGDGANFAEQKEDVRASIELWEQRVRKKLQQIDQILQGLDLQQIQAQKVAVESLIEILDDLDEEASAIIAAHDQVGPDLKLYRDALLRAPDLFRKIADDLEDRAAEKKSTFLKEAYADFAGEARKLASAYETKAAGVGGLELEVAQKMEFVRESREFIGDVRTFLGAIPADHGLETERLIARINKYIVVFQEAINSIKDVADKIGDQPQPMTPNPADAKPNAVTRTSPTASVSVGEYRQRLAALKR